MSPAVPLELASILLRLAILVAAFVFLYMFFGYYVAWRNPELQRFYGGPELATFWAALRHNWTSSPWIYTLAAFRALLYVVFLYPLVRIALSEPVERCTQPFLNLRCGRSKAQEPACQGAEYQVEAQGLPLSDSALYSEHSTFLSTSAFCREGGDPVRYGLR
jgi:hypothetical protein